MYDKTEIKVLKKIYLEPGIHKRAISRELNLTMPSIDHHLKKLSNVIKQKRSGNQINYFLDYSKEDLTPLICVLEHSRFKKLPNKTKLAITDFLKELEEKPLIALIFGSYANNSFNESSDIDLLLVFQSLKDFKQIENLAKKVSMKTNTTLSPVYLNYEEFVGSFNNSTKEFFKQIRQNKLILIGTEWWRQLIHEQT